MTKKVVSAVLVVLLVFSLFCSCEKDEGNYPVTVGETEIKSAPEKVVCLSEFAASAVCALGYKSYLSGAVTEYIQTTGSDVTDIGVALSPDWDSIYNLAPQVIITPLKLSSSVKQALNLREISVVVLETPEKYSDVANYYTELSKLFLGKNKSEKTANTYNTEVKNQLLQIKQDNGNINLKVAVFIEEGFLVTGDTLAGEVLEMVNIKNIASNETEYMMSIDKLLKADPDVIFCAEGLSESILENDYYKDITAVKKGSVYEIDIAALLYAGEGFCSTLKDMSGYLKKQ